VIFQPHRYSRTFHLYQEFGKAFSDADVLILTDIYSAGESPIDNVNGELIYKEVINSGHKDVKYIPEKENISDYLLDIIHDGDLVITMGAGDICKVGDELVEKLAKSPNAGSV
jgi:UDP-N-acetylmuramate--alanine ligase